MFQTVKPEEIFDQSYWQVSESHPAYWLAQLRKKEWIRLLFLLSLKPASKATKPILARQVLEKLEFQLCDDRLEAYRAWQQNPGSIVIQYRHSETDWSCGIPEILPPEMGDHLGFVNIAGRLVCRPRISGQGDIILPSRITPEPLKGAVSYDNKNPICNANPR